jgi:hypothetical protein
VYGFFQDKKQRKFPLRLLRMLILEFPVIFKQARLLLGENPPGPNGVKSGKR